MCTRFARLTVPLNISIAMCDWRKQPNSIEVGLLTIVVKVRESVRMDGGSDLWRKRLQGLKWELGYARGLDVLRLYPAFKDVYIPWFRFGGRLIGRALSSDDLHVPRLRVGLRTGG